jgi:hypothetical protein
MAIGHFWRRTKWDHERREEIESYVQIETDENLARGMPVEEACFAAQRKFGNATLVREEIYRLNTLQFLTITGASRWSRRISPARFGAACPTPSASGLSRFPEGPGTR